jgi:hypothetical protein
MSEAHAVPLIHKVEMRVELHNMDRLLAIEGIDAGDIDRVVAAQHDRDRACFKDFADAGGDIGVAGLGIGMDNVGIANIDDPRGGCRQIGMPSS